MTRRVLVPLLALAGVAAAVATVVSDRPSGASLPENVAAPSPPYASYVAGAGLVEAETGNISIGTPVSGLIAAIYVRWGEEVKAGDPLFKIDDRDLQAELPVARAQVAEAEASVAQADYLLGLARHLRRESINPAEDLELRRFAADSDRAALATRRAELRRVEAEIDRRTVRAPVAGRILQLDARLGERAESGPGSPTLMVLGGDERLHVRVDVDEDDAWRFRPGALARAFVRGNPALSAPLRFVRVEPLVVPKTSLTGASAERTDTRVLQLIYSFDPAALPVYVGQQLDVFIDAPPASATPPGRGAAATGEDAGR